jgi:predicted DNA-binding protein YlxM (UPF0122 family)
MGTRMKGKSGSGNNPKEGGKEGDAAQEDGKKDKSEGRGPIVWGGSTKRERCQLLGAGLRTQPLRSEDEAWTLVTENRKLVHSLLYKKGILPLPEKSRALEEEVLALGFDAAFFAALTWNEKKGTFGTHLEQNIKRVYKVIGEISGSIVMFPAYLIQQVFSYRRWKGFNPEGTYKDYAKENGVTSTDAKKIALLDRRQRLAESSLDGHAYFNSAPFSRTASGGVSPHQLRNRDAAEIVEANQLGDPFDLAAKEQIRSRLWEIVGKAVRNERDKKILFMYFAQEKNAVEIGKAVGISGQAVRKIIAKSLKLLRSNYQSELEELLAGLAR